MAKLTVDKVKGLIDEMMGNVSMVARTLNVSRTTLYNYINSHATVKQALDEAREKMIDNVESKLYSKALDGDTTAMIFFLKTQGKLRGYVERQEVTGADGGAVLVKWDDENND
jgi:AcrR family transcriptional regulator